MSKRTRILGRWSGRATAFLPLLALVLASRASAAAARFDVSNQLERPDEWFTSAEGRKILDNVLSWQNPNGGWWKAYDSTVPRPAEPIEDTSGWHRTSTFDNRATHSELRLLARALRLTHDTKYRDGFLRGMKFVFDAQYPNGGWPQRFPLEDNYGRHITFNDGAMEGVMRLLADVADEKPDFEWCEPDLRRRARAAFDRGVKCILATQIKVNGQLTAWCQQHDAETLAPAGARKYELPSIVGAESAGILSMLMRIEAPSEDVKQSIRAAAAWFERSRLTGKRFVTKKDPSLPKGRDRLIVDDPTAEPIWARFYDIETNRPFFCGRDGVKKWSLAEVEAERRSGYAWYGAWGTPVLKEYAKWAAKYGGGGDSAAAAAASPTTTASKPPLTINVSPDKTGGDFTTVQAAVDSIPANNDRPVVIHIKPGVYKERVRVGRNKPFVTFRGEDANTTVLTYDLCATKVIPPDTRPVGTKYSYSTLVEADDFTAERITFENNAGDVGQAVALRTTGRRATFRNCRMLGWQDTLYVYDGTARFTDCYVEGRVDFIFGWATAVFERCHIHSKNGGYVTAASTPKESRFGFVFLDCKLTGDGAPAYLGRPWRDDAAVAFIRCDLGSHVRPEGWDNWGKPERERTTRFAEYKCTGPGADRSKRVPWSHELNDAEAADYTVGKILGADADVAGRASPSTGASPVRIILVGDSTVTDKQGWGPGFKALLKDDVECVNAALGGRSSKSFRTEGHWDAVVAEKADYVLIQFGHNDQPGKGLDRETTADTDYRANMKRYVEEARANGMKPVLVTSLTRRQFGPDGKIRSTLTPYVDAEKRVAAETGTPLIDLHARSIALCETLGPEGCKSISPPKGDGYDGTHLNEKGAELIGRLVAEELAAAVPELAPHLKLRKPVAAK